MYCRAKVRYLAFAVFLAYLLVLGAAFAQAQQQKLEWWMWSASEDVVAKFRQIEALFDSTHDDLEIQLILWPYGGYREKVVTAVAAGIPPAIVQADSGMHQYFAEHNAIAELSPLIRELNLSDFFLPVLESARISGRWYGITPFFHTYGMYLNMDAVAETGLVSPLALATQGDWTWDAYLTAAKKLTKPDGDRTARYGVGIGGESLGPYIWSSGGEFTDETMTEFLLDTPEAIRGLRFYQALHTEHGVVGLHASFSQGQTAMWYNGTWNRLGLAKGAAFDWDVVEFPIHPVVRRPTVLLDRAILTIPVGPQDPGTTRTLLQFFLSTEVQRIYASTFDVIPVRRSVAVSSAFLKSGAPYGQDINTMAFVSAVATGRFHPYTPEWQRAYADGLQWERILKGEVSVQEAILKTKSLFTSLMEERQQQE